MSDSIKLRPPFVLARCCSPKPGDAITGYHSYDGAIKVHSCDCSNLSKSEQERLVTLEWADILDEPEFQPGDDIARLDDIDYRILQHHLQFDVDYSLKVARMLAIEKQDAFDHHQKLRSLGLLERVEPLMIQYRKGVIDHKWIKHRNHTYYGLTEKGRRYLEYHLNQGAESD